MITIALTNRNRDLQTITTCLDSLIRQSCDDFDVIFIDYGSGKKYINGLKETLIMYPFIDQLYLDVQQQLWNKSKSINIALRKSKQPFFFVADIDMIFHPDFIDRLKSFTHEKHVTYFQVGFLTKDESEKVKDYHAYNVSFASTEDATGMTLFPTDLLKSVNGYDEFYHGWGGEDTDVHIRLKNAGYNVTYYDKEILMLHQWHEKTYRSNLVTTPFHSNLEKINQDYLLLVKKSNKIVANETFEWGVFDNEIANSLEILNDTYTIYNTASSVKAFAFEVMHNTADKVIYVSIKEHPQYKSFRQYIKRIVHEKTLRFMNLNAVNDFILEQIIINFRNCPYRYAYNQNEKEIQLTIKL